MTRGEIKAQLDYIVLHPKEYSLTEYRKQVGELEKQLNN